MKRPSCIFMRGTCAPLYARVVMWTMTQNSARRVPNVFLLLCCSVSLMANRGSAQLRNSEVETLFAYSVQHGVLSSEYPEFKTSLSRRQDSGKHSHREYIVFNGYGQLVRDSGLLHEVCVIREDWHFKRQQLIKINQFIVCQHAFNPPEGLKSHKYIIENSSGTVLRIAWKKFSANEAYAVQRTVADRFLADAQQGLTVR